MTFEVKFSETARQDLVDLYLFIAERDGDDPALAYVERIEQHCLRLQVYPERGRLYGPEQPALRILPFGRRVVIIYHIHGAQVFVDRVFYGGQNVERALMGAPWLEDDPQ
ncbi:type II toxin-antitoxin system RelE/ParE family toxin [Pelagibacterium xiamenense]|uniref:type II toxin-antitoxin system RelE/ParE family toxin n=1 Tax=Pelagibacterium xiamenense TaxID=2901140 RepID=UPI001E5E596F|nr:type II toxin-antitoxin system RelE/ParE family toxin [Pelagibacterium xiamenense]